MGFRIEHFVDSFPAVFSDDAPVAIFVVGGDPGGVAITDSVGPIIHQGANGVPAGAIIVTVSGHRLGSNLGPKSARIVDFVRRARQVRLVNSGDG